MPISRRGFLRGLGAGGAGLALSPALSGHELASSSALSLLPHLARSTGPIQLDRNENPNGPGRHVLEAIQAAFGDASRYPDDPEEALRKAIAASYGLTPEWVLMGCGSTEILRVAVMAFCRADRPLVTAAPTFEEPVRMATALKGPVAEVMVDRGMRLDLGAMADAAARPPAGLVFCCNPNNPTATVHGSTAIRDFLARTHSASPETTVLVDEAYHDFVEDPSYATAIPLVKDDPRLVVSRTFSKVYGLAGFRVGYAIARPETITAMRPWRCGNSINLGAAAGAVAAMGAPAHIRSELAISREARAFTRKFFEGLGYKVEPSETNFVMVNIRRDSKEFKDACLARGVMVGRQFPQFKQHTRISIGSMDEMDRATRIFRAVLALR
jgi:histidinol-phosphate aminotransferase